MSTLVYWAFFSGGIAAFSLTLGSLVGLTLRIPSYIIGILAAFGAGALRQIYPDLLLSKHREGDGPLV